MDNSSYPLTVGNVSSANSTGASTLSASPRTCDCIAVRGWSIVLTAAEIVDGHPLHVWNCDLHHMKGRSRNGYGLLRAGLGLGRCRRVVGF
jgi:hypothetical protein